MLQLTLHIERLLSLANVQNSQFDMAQNMAQSSWLALHAPGEV